MAGFSGSQRLAAAGWGEHATARGQLEGEADGVASPLADSCTSGVQRACPLIEASLEEVCGALGGVSWEGVIVPRWDGLARLDALRVAIRCRMPCLATRAGVLPHSGNSCSVRRAASVPRC
eukprot:700638-Alexandrium_andersonii.AAC.1